MKQFLIFLGLIRPKGDSSYTDWPKKGEPLRISKTLLPASYVNHDLDKDKQDYSRTIINT